MNYKRSQSDEYDPDDEFLDREYLDPDSCAPLDFNSEISSRDRGYTQELDQALEVKLDELLQDDEEVPDDLEADVIVEDDDELTEIINKFFEEVLKG